MPPSDAQGPELTLLTQYLDEQREAILRKTDGLSREQLARQLPPSSLHLAGLLNHLALVETSWLEGRFLGRPETEPWAGVDWEGDPDWEFRMAAELEPAEVHRCYLDACASSRAVVAGATGLDQVSVLPLRTGELFSLRWVLLHLIEETARHAGHADLLREAVDGSVGD